MEKKKTENRTGAGTGRDARGRFTKGVSGNPHGRRKTPPELEDLASMAPAQLLKIAQDVETNQKTAADIWKWLYEAYYGKPSQRVETDQNITTAAETTIKFEGVLDEWSK